MQHEHPLLDQADRVALAHLRVGALLLIPEVDSRRRIWRNGWSAGIREDEIFLLLNGPAQSLSPEGLDAWVELIQQVRQGVGDPGPNMLVWLGLMVLGQSGPPLTGRNAVNAAMFTEKVSMWDPADLVFVLRNGTGPKILPFPLRS